MLPILFEFPIKKTSELVTSCSEGYTCRSMTIKPGTKEWTGEG